MTGSDLLTVKDILFEAGQDPYHHAIECPGLQPLTYRDLRLQALSVVRNLNSRGFVRNDRIALVSPAGPDTAAAIISVMAGFTCVPLNPHEREQAFRTDYSMLEISAVLVRRGYDTAATAAAESCGIPVIGLVPSPDMAGLFRLEPAGQPGDAEPECALPDDLASLLLTSGTTRGPKVVPLTQKRLCRDAQLMKVYRFNDTDRHLHIMPYYHLAGIKGPLIAPLLTGGTVICTTDFIPSDFPHLLQEYRPTQYAAVPALHQGILKEIRKLPPEALKNNSLRGIRSGSVSLPAAVRQELEQLLGVAVTEGYAMSEAGTITVNYPPRTGSVGIPVIESLGIMDEKGTLLGQGETGEIVVRGETVFEGYMGEHGDNRDLFIDGWFRTGDRGYLDADGYLFLTGRTKEMINKGGEKISPEEIDRVLKSHPSVADAMSFGIADSVLGEDVAAMVVLSDDRVTETDLRGYLLDRLVPFKIPGRIHFVDTIPRNPAGKPLRHEGTQRYSKTGNCPATLSSQDPRPS